MAHFAKINSGIVETVIVVSDNDCGGGVFPDSELVGQSFIDSLGLEGDWIQTSYNGNFRKQYGFVGFAYDAVKDQFVSFSPFPSWSLDVNNDWQPPTPKPEGEYIWDEETLAWVEVTAG
jgi:hypothetical protein